MVEPNLGKIGVESSILSWGSMVLMKNKRMLNGYVLVHCPDHPKSLASMDYYVYEHVIVAEKSLGRPILDDEEVHHLDFDRSNNRPDNLLVLRSSEHRRLHNWLDKGAPGWVRRPVKLKATEVYCKSCSEVILGQGSSFCSEACRGKFHRKVSRPSKEELSKLLETMTYTGIGHLFGVSDNAVRKWVKSYKLNGPVAQQIEQ